MSIFYDRKLSLFTDTNKLKNFKYFDGHIHEYIGKNLEKWIKFFLKDLGITNNQIIKSKIPSNCVIEGLVYIDSDVKLEHFVHIKGPAYIGFGSEIRNGAYIRPNTYIGKNCLIGHSTEVKNSVVFDYAKAAHFSYIGDSILGMGCNLGAGTKLANVKLKKNEIKIFNPIDKKFEFTKFKKLGSIIGENSQIGCNCVLSPGSLLFPNSKINPLSHIIGSVYQNRSFPSLSC